MILTLSAVALATFLVANVARARRRRRARVGLPQLAEMNPAPTPKAEDLRAAFAVGLGDVVLLKTGEEAWLSGVLVFDEGVQTLALFVGPDSGGSRFVLAGRSSSSEAEPELTWLAEAKDVVVGDGVHVLEHEGERLTRERRRPLAVKRTGPMAPDVGGSAVVSEYRGELGGAIVVVKGERRTVILSGRRLHPGTYDVLPGTETE